MTKVIDTHQHFWNVQLVEYPWLGPGHGPLYRNYEPPELEPQLRAAGIDDADRLLFGSDGPVCVLAGDYAKVWAETNRALEGYSVGEREAILGGTAVRVYRL